MTIRNLDALFAPKSIALIGASNRLGSVGAVLARNLYGAGFAGPIMSVNPHERAIRSSLNYHAVADLPQSPDLGVIATPPAAVPELIAELGARGCRAAIVITAGFGEGARAEGQALRQDMLNAARPHLLRILGPNCLGLMSPHQGINASFAHLNPKAGKIAFLTQSGAVATAVLDWAHGRGIGFSHIVSLGDMSDIDFGDLLDYFTLDPETGAILLYVEQITHARKFMSAARAAARAKPVVVVKAGRSAAGAQAALSHTGALAGADMVYDAAFRRAGLLRVDTLAQLFEAVATLATGIRLDGEALTILTNGGGLGVLAADEADAQGIALAPLSPGLMEKLEQVLPEPWSRGNPIDILGDADGARYQAALEALLAEGDGDGQGAVLVINCPTAVADSLDGARAVAECHDRHPDSAILTCWLGDVAAAPARDLFGARGLASYETPEQAVRAHAHLLRYQRGQALLMQAPARDAAQLERDIAAAREILAAAVAEQRRVLTEAEAKALLAAYRIDTVPTHVAADEAEAGRLADEIGGAVALKILSRDISHKSDVGGVALDLEGGAAVRAAAGQMRQRIARQAPKARLDGFTVQPMIKRPHAQELIAGISVDPLFGPVLLFGQGGTAVEVIGDRVVGLPPLNTPLAHDMIAATRVAKLLKGYRDRPAADLDAIADVLRRLGQMASDLGEIAELDINPLLADQDGVIALDARVVIRLRRAGQAPALAIQPYPAALARDLALPELPPMRLRAIKPQDAPALARMLQQADPADIRMRFFAAIDPADPVMAARLTQLDYDRELALVAVKLDGEGRETDSIAGIVRLAGDPDRVSAELALMVGAELKAHGLGRALIEAAIDHARGQGYQRLDCDVLRDNQPMLALLRDQGFTAAAGSPGDPALVLSLDLTAPDPGGSA